MAERSISYYMITAGYSGLMARFDDDGRLIEWTPFIRDASYFLTSEACAAAIRDITRPEIEAAIRAGWAVREYDEELGETVVLDLRGRYARPMRTPSLTVRGQPRMLAPAGAAKHVPSRRFVREMMRDAKINPKRRSEALIQPTVNAGTDYTAPISAPARRARAFGGYGRSA